MVNQRAAAVKGRNTRAAALGWRGRCGNGWRGVEQGEGYYSSTHEQYPEIFHPRLVPKTRKLAHGKIFAPDPKIFGI